MSKAEVEARGNPSSIDYTITGSLAAVEEAIDLILRNYNPLGYGTHFNKPIELPDGRWRARGYRYHSCD